MAFFLRAQKPSVSAGIPTQELHTNPIQTFFRRHSPAKGIAMAGLAFAMAFLPIQARAQNGPAHSKEPPRGATPTIVNEVDKPHAFSLLDRKFLGHYFGMTIFDNSAGLFQFAPSTGLEGRRPLKEFLYGARTFIGEQVRLPGGMGDGTLRLELQHYALWFLNNSLRRTETCQSWGAEAFVLLNACAGASPYVGIGHYWLGAGKGIWGARPGFFLKFTAGDTPVLLNLDGDFSKFHPPLYQIGVSFPLK